MTARKMVLFLQVATEAVPLAMDGGDNFRGVRSGFKMLTNATDGHVHGTVVRLQLTAGHFLQQFRTRLDFARIFAEVQHGHWGLPASGY